MSSQGDSGFSDRRVVDRHPCAADHFRLAGLVGGRAGLMLRTRRNHGSITTQGVRAHGASHVLARHRTRGGVAVGVYHWLWLARGRRRTATRSRRAARLPSPPTRCPPCRSTEWPGPRSSSATPSTSAVPSPPPGRPARRREQHRAAVQLPGLRPDHRHLLSFAPSFNAQVRAIAVSPDKKILYVGGQFTQVNGANRYRLVAFDLTKSPATVLTSFTATTDASVYGLAATREPGCTRSASSPRSTTARERVPSPSTAAPVSCCRSR